MFRRSWALFLLLWLVAQPAGLRLALRLPPADGEDPQLRSQTTGGRWAVSEGASPSELRACPASGAALRTSADFWSLPPDRGLSASPVTDRISESSTAPGTGRRLPVAAASPRAPPAFS
jgi:hypothetical protein